MWTRTKLTKLLNIDYPIVQGPFGSKLSSVELATTVSRMGGMGSFGAQPFSPTNIVEIANNIRQKTDKPFAINLWVKDRDDRLATYSDDDYKELLAIFKPYFDEFNIPLPPRPADMGPKFEDQVQAILDARPPVFSFVYGIPPKDVLDEVRKRGIITIGTATTPEEAFAIEQAGIDAVVATGFEAGGHRVSFLHEPDEVLTGTMALVPQVADSVSIPVIAAGGIADGRGIKASLSLGADAVQIGTAFLATRQSGATDMHKEVLFSPEARHTTLTRLFTGRPARGIKSRLTEELKEYEKKVAPFPLQSHFLSSLRAGMVASGKPGQVTFWSGQSAALLKYHDAEELFRALVTHTDSLYRNC